MSVEDRKQSPSVDLETNDDWDTALSTVEPDVQVASEERSDFDTDVEESDALLTVLLDETEPPEQVAASQVEPPTPEPSGITHSAAADGRAFEQAGEVTIDVDAGEDESLDETTAGPVVEPAEIVTSPPPQLVGPEVRQFSADDETLVSSREELSFAPADGSPQEVALHPVVEATPAPTPALFSTSSLALAGLTPPPDESEAPPVAPSALFDERPASAHLEASGQSEAFLTRSHFLEAEATAAQDPSARARGLLLAAELAAMAGDEPRARELSSLALEAEPGHPLALRASRAFALRDGDLDAALRLFDAEHQRAEAPAARAHASLFAAEIARELFAEPTPHEERLDAALSASPEDLRAILAKRAAAITAPEGGTHPWLDASASASLAVSAFTQARDAFRARDIEAAVEALEDLAALPTADASVALLGAVVAMASTKTSAKALPLLDTCLDSEAAPLARRWKALSALELGDTEAIERLLGDPDPRAWKTWERLTLAALSSARAHTVEPCVAEALGDPELWPLAAGVANALADVDLPARTEWTAGAPETQARVRLARMLAARAPSDDLREAARTLEASDGSLLGAALLADLDRRDGRFTNVAEAPRDPSLEGGSDRDRALFSGILFELGGEVSRAHAEYERAREMDPAFEAATRASIETGLASSPSETLVELAASLEDADRAAFILVEAALRASESPGTAETADALFEQAKEKAPALALTSWLTRGDASNGAHPERAPSLDPIERAHMLFREALHERDRSKAAALLAEASRAHPADVTLREAYERISPETPADRASYWGARAASAEGAEQARFALLAALESERLGERDAAVRLADLAISAGEGRFAKLLKARLLGEASTEAEPEAPLPPEDPAYLASLRRIEHRLISEGKEDDLEPIFSAIASALSDPETTSHAAVAARLRRRKSPSASVVDLAREGLRTHPPSLFALRQLESGAGEALEAMEAALALAERTTRPLERATLFLRASEAAERAGEGQRSLDLLQRALEAEPTHWVALDRLATVADRLGAQERAALAYERLAEQSQVETHVVEAHRRAAALWIEDLRRPERGLAALEAAFALAPTHPGLFDQLIAAHRAMGDDEAVSRLLVQRLDSTPEDVDALRTLSELCEAREDWGGLERALLRLAEVTKDPEERAAFGLRLGDLYRGPLADLGKAEAAYLDVIEATPGDFSARERLVDLYREQGEGAKALAVQEWLIEAAAASEEKKRRTLELARAHEELMGDPRRAEATLEALSKQFPNDPDVLEASVSLLLRASRHDDASAKLAKALDDARRALTTGRFDPAHFAQIARASALRGDEDAARVAEATLGAIAGRVVEVAGCGMEATSPDLADLLAPELLSRPLRALLRRTGDVLDAALPFDGSASQPLAPEHASLETEIRSLAEGFGLDIEIHTSRDSAFACIPAQTSPPRIVLGASLLTTSDEAVRRFLVLRALQILSIGGGALARSSPQELFPLTIAYLQSIHPGAPSFGIDTSQVEVFADKIAPKLAGRVDDELRALALEVADSLGSRTSALQSALYAFGNRTALLAIGDPVAGLTATAFASGDPSALPQGGRERVSWIARNAEARDLVVFSVGETYARARALLAEPDISVDIF